MIAIADAPSTAIVTAEVETPLGPMLLAASEVGACLAEFSDEGRHDERRTRLGRLFRRPVADGQNGHLEQLREELEAYFAGEATVFRVPLDTPGTAFQRVVWDALRAIPFGRTRSYRELAAELGKAGASRAVGRANGSNRLAVVIPCHRVINADGGLGGYAGGLERKRALLEWERRVASAQP